MPVYNTGKFLDESIKSVINQTLQDFEFIIIDDKSTDNSVEVIKKYIYDKRINFLQNDKNYGIAYNRNLGLKLAKTDIIVMVDSDDINLLERFEKEYIYLLEHKHISIVGSYAQLIDENGIDIGNIIKPLYQDEIKKVCFYYSPFLQPTIMFRKKHVLEVGAYRVEYTRVEDIDLYYRLLFSGYQGANLPLNLVKYRKHKNSSDIHHKEKGIASLRLKREMIKKFNLKLSLIEKLSMYVHYFLDTTLTHKQKKVVENFIKKIIIKNK